MVSDKNLRNKLIGLLALAEHKTSFCRDWRNRRFAHYDLELALNENNATELKAVNRESVNAGLKALADVLNAIELHYFKAGTSFDAIAGHNGATTLLYVLGDGLMQRQKREELIQRGDVSELDLPEQI